MRNHSVQSDPKLTHVDTQCQLTVTHGRTNKKGDFLSFFLLGLVVWNLFGFGNMRSICKGCVDHLPFFVFWEKTGQSKLICKGCVDHLPVFQMHWLPTMHCQGRQIHSTNSNVCILPIHLNKYKLPRPTNTNTNCQGQQI